MPESSEPLLINHSNKYTIFPIDYPDIWNACKTHEKAIWFADEIDLSTDLEDWKKLNENEKHFIKHVLAFFAASDGIVMENLASRFCSEIQIAEARQFYSVQIFMESVHSEVYSRLIETYIPSSEEKNKLFNAIETIPAIGKKAKWAEKWIESDVSFATRLVAFAFVEGVFFSGSFCAIYWIKEKGILRGLCSSNDFIARDEGLHTSFASMLYKDHIIQKLSQNEVEIIVREAVDIEKEFITESLPCSLLGMNSSRMIQYIEYVADRLLKQLGHDPIYNSTQPFDFMERISLQNLTNFFESRPTEYQKSAFKSIQEKKKENELTFDEDF